MKYFGQLKLTSRQLSYIMTALYLLCLLPLLAIARYDFPSSDDFSMALETHLTWEATGSFIATIAACAAETIDLYFTWTGYFTSSFLTSISPASFDIHLYWVSVVIVLAVLQASVALFLYVLLQKILHMDRYVRRCASAAVLFIMIQMMPQGSARVECFYWYSGAGNYTLTFSILLLYLTCFLLCIYAQTAGHRRLFLVLACICAFLTGGANYMSALTGAILTFLLGVILALIRTGQMQRWVGKEHFFSCGEWRLSLLIPMALFFCGFFLNCFAPGNAVRSEQTSGFGAVKSILISLYYTLDYCMDDWLNWSVLIVLAILGILFWVNMPASSTAMTFRHPVVIVLLGYGIVSANITPVLFATGNLGAGRNQGLFWMQFALTAVFTEWYLIGWLWRKLHCADVEYKGNTGAGRTILFLSFLLFAGSCMCVKVDPDYYSFTSALEDLVNGDAAIYAAENEARLAILQDESQEDVLLVQHSVHPDLLFYSDVEENVDGWDNYTMRYYFGKNSVTGERFTQ